MGHRESWRERMSLIHTPSNPAPIRMTPMTWTSFSTA
jgi:hypothetical protein